MLTFHIFTFIISLFLLNAKETPDVIITNAKKTPDMIVVLTRHGAREPYSSAWDKSWKNSQEVVDSGVEQSFVLGAVLAEAYADLLKDIDMREVWPIATVKARTEMTVSAVLLGLFHQRSHDHRKDLSKKDFLMPYIDQDLVNKVIDGVLATPEIIPNRMQLLHQTLTTYKAEESDTFEPLDCWLIKDSVPHRFGDAANEKMFAEIEGTVTKLRELGYPARNLAQLVNDADIMVSRFSDNRPALPGIPYDGELYKELEFVLHWWCLYNFIGPEIERSVRVYPLYRNMITWFKERVNGDRNTKVILIGGHESAMFPFLNVHQIVNSTCFHKNYKAEKAGKRLPYPDCINPDFAAQIIYELYDVNTTAPYIRFLYNGKPFKICPEIEGVECPLSEFERMFPIWTSNLTEEAYQAQCVAPGAEAELQKNTLNVKYELQGKELQKATLREAKLNSALDICEDEASALEAAQRIRSYLPVVTGILGVIIGLLPYCLKLEKGKKFAEYAKNIKKTGLILLKPKFTHKVMAEFEEGESEGIETSEGRAKKEVAISP